jgi:hypothetical protein
MIVLNDEKRGYLEVQSIGKLWEKDERIILNSIPFNNSF